VTTLPKIDWRQHKLVRECERVDTTRMLMIADAYDTLAERYPDDMIATLLVVPVQGGVTATERLREATRVHAYWPDELLTMAMLADAAWNSLAEPPRWSDVDPGDVFGFVRGWLSLDGDGHGKWPRIDDLRRRFDKNPTNRLPGQIPGQASLEI
jgi:hypothetical protein